MMMMMITTTGGGLFSWIDGEDLQTLELEEGDVHRIESGTVFYFLNHHQNNQKMHVFGIHDLEAGGSSRSSVILLSVCFIYNSNHPIMGSLLYFLML